MMESLAARVEVTSRAGQMPLRIKLLIAAHFALGAMPVLGMRLALSSRGGGLLWLIQLAFCGPIAAILLASFWAGMVERRTRRVLAILGGASAYLSLFTFGLIISGAEELWAVAGFFAAGVAIYLAVGLAMMGVWIVVRRRWAALQFVDPGDRRRRFPPSQFSIQALLILTFAVALNLALNRISRGQDLHAAVRVVCNTASVAVSFSAVMLAAAWSALFPGPVRWRLATFAIAALSLGAAQTLGLSAANLNSQAGRAVTLMSIVQFAVPAALFAASLIVIRSCGYRLVPLAKTDRADA